ncbi:iron-containing alcohol dehydrogenase, partial [Microvirga sp. 3-52]|nr:iron-containing alcohol dehydrogenase [Microvirga sp. 3-52]
KRALIVSDGIMEGLGYIERCVNSLNEKSIESVTYIGVKSEPSDKYVDEALTLFKDNNCDIILSLGGGSCIDTAKAVAVVATNGGYIGDYMGGKKM